MMPADFQFLRGLARIDWKDPAISIEFDQLRSDRRSGDLHAEIFVAQLRNENDRDQAMFAVVTGGSRVSGSLTG